MRLTRGKSVAEGLWHRFEEGALRPGSHGELGAMAREELARLCRDRVATGFVHGGSSGFYVQSYVSRFGVQDHCPSFCCGREQRTGEVVTCGVGRSLTLQPPAH